MSYFTSSKYERMMNRIPRPLREGSKPALPKCHLPAHLTRLGHRRSLSSVSRRAIAYSLTSSDTPTIYSTRQRTPHVQGDP